MRSERKDKQAQNVARRAKIVNAFVLRLFLHVRSAKIRSEDPKLSPLADDAITRGGIGGLGSLLTV